MLTVSIKKYLFGVFPYWKHYKCESWLIVTHVKLGDEMVRIAPQLSLTLSDRVFHIIPQLERLEFKVETAKI